MSKKIALNKKLLIGRSEWCALPDLKIKKIKAKIDTGAKTSAIHAVNMKIIKKFNQKWVYFDVYPLQRNQIKIIHCHAPLFDLRKVMSSSGHKENRYVILTVLNIGNQSWPIEVTLSNRDPLQYRMILGREALSNKVLIDPSIACHQNRIESSVRPRRLEAKDVALSRQEHGFESRRGR
ncbi:MAG: putative ribosomal protein S6 modification protein [uncultured bacterium]|nr:MAG: putative ribosomal protein S6 modification protein [uncultured bacterium]